MVDLRIDSGKSTDARKEAEEALRNNADSDKQVELSKKLEEAQSNEREAMLKEEAKRAEYGRRSGEAESLGNDFASAEKAQEAAREAKAAALAYQSAKEAAYDAASHKYTDLALSVRKMESTLSAQEKAAGGKETETPATSSDKTPETLETKREKLNAEKEKLRGEAQRIHDQAEELKKRDKELADAEAQEKSKGNKEAEQPSPGTTTQQDEEKPAAKGAPSDTSTSGPELGKPGEGNAEKAAGKRPDDRIVGDNRILKDVPGEPQMTLSGDGVYLGGRINNEGDVVGAQGILSIDEDGQIKNAHNDSGEEMSEEEIASWIKKLKKRGVNVSRRPKSDARSFEPVTRG